MPFYESNGSISVRDGIRLSVTVDERIADGFYFAKSIKILKKIIENPELIERPINEPVDA